MASSAYEESGPAVSVGRVLSRAFGVIGSNPTTMFGIAFLFGAVPTLALTTLRLHLQGAIVDRYSALGMATVSIASGIIGLVLAMLVQGALVRTTVAYSEGRRASFGESVSAGLEVALPLVGLALLMGLAIGLGLMLLLVPGIILYVIWAVASPALVEEKIGVFGAFGRSRELTKGARWKVFGLELIVIVVIWMISAVLGLLLLRSIGLNDVQALRRTGLPISWLIMNALISTLINAFWSAIQTSLYVELRTWKDGPSVRGLEEIFA
jgi:hypothetical protein